MAKSPYDLATLASILQGKDYGGSLTRSWEGLRVGFVDPALWQPASFIVEPREDFRKQSVLSLFPRLTLRVVNFF
jgi:amidase